MNFPLSNKEMHIINEIKNSFEGRSEFVINPNDEQEWQDVLYLMNERSVVKTIKIRSGTHCLLIGNMDIFQEWVKEENNKAKRITRREWYLMITTTVLSVILSTILNNILHIINWFKG